MPIYEYHCNGCGHDFEEMTSMADRDATRPCPHCGTKKTDRKCSAIATGRAEGHTHDHSHGGGCGHCCGGGHCKAHG